MRETRDIDYEGTPWRTQAHNEVRGKIRHLYYASPARMIFPTRIFYALFLPRSSANPRSRTVHVVCAQRRGACMGHEETAYVAASTEIVIGLSASSEESADNVQSAESPS